MLFYFLFISKVMKFVYKGLYVYILKIYFKILVFIELLKFDRLLWLIFIWIVKSIFWIIYKYLKLGYIK